MEILLTIYTLLNVVFAAYLVVMICLSNVLPHKVYPLMVAFFPATIVIGVVGWIGYTFNYYMDKRGGNV